MVGAITSLTGNGLKDWFIQRISAVYLVAYFVFLALYWYGHTPLTYAVWQGLFHMLVMQIATILALLMFLVHAWIGIWTVTTDYIKCTALRVSAQMAVALFLLAQLLWGIIIVRGVSL